MAYVNHKDQKKCYHRKTTKTFTSSLRATYSLYVAHTGCNRQRNKNIQDPLLEKKPFHKLRMLLNDGENALQQSNLESLMFF